MQPEFLRLADLTDRDRGAWRDLSDHAVEPNPFFDLDFVLPAARALGEYSDVRLLVVKSGPSWVACLPVRRYKVWHRVPLPCTATWRHIYCLLGTPLVAPDRETETMSQIISGLCGLGGNALGALDWVSMVDHLREATLDALPSKTLVFEDFQRASLERRPQNDYLDGWVKSKERREFRRRSRLLGEELGSEPSLADHTGCAGSIDEFLAMESSGWKGNAGTALASNPEHARFFRETLQDFARRGTLKLDFLEVGGVRVAATCDLVAGDVDFCFKVAYDERFSRFAPGRDLSLRMIDCFHADTRLQMMDSCTAPDNEVYNRLWRNRRRVQTFAFGAGGRAASIAIPTLRAAMLVRDRNRGRADENRPAD